MVQNYRKYKYTVETAWQTIPPYTESAPPGLSTYCCLKNCAADTATASPNLYGYTLHVTCIQQTHSAGTASSQPLQSISHVNSCLPKKVCIGILAYSLHQDRETSEIRIYGGSCSSLSQEGALATFSPYHFHVTNNWENIVHHLRPYLIPDVLNCS